MLNLRKHKKKHKPNKPKPTGKFKNCSHVSYTTQKRTVLVIFPLNLQTIRIAQILSAVGKGCDFEQGV